MGGDSWSHVKATALRDQLREHNFFSHVQNQGKVVWHDVNAVGKYTRYASGVGWKTFLNLWNEIGNDLSWDLKCELNHVLFCNHSLRSSGATSDVLQEFPCRPCPERQVQKPRNSTGWLQPANHSNRCPFAPIEFATSRGNTPRNHEVWLQNNGISRGLRTLQLNSRVLPRHGTRSQDQGKMITKSWTLLNCDLLKSPGQRQAFDDYILYVRSMRAMLTFKDMYAWIYDWYTHINIYDTFIRKSHPIMLQTYCQLRANHDPGLRQGVRAAIAQSNAQTQQSNLA